MKAQWKNVTIIGTSHVSSQSIKEIKTVFEQEKPDAVAIELDPPRYHALIRDEKPFMGIGMIRHVGVSGFFFVLIGRYLQKKIGNIVGTSPGDDMKSAAELAIGSHVDLHFIDQPITQTLADFSKHFKLKEKLRMLKDVIIPPKEAKKIMLSKQDLRRVPSDAVVSQLLGFISARYPGIYEALIAKRNRHMARKLFMMHHEPAGKRILVVVGAGHVEGMMEELKRLERTIDIV